MRIGRNLAAGLASSVWTALLGIAFVPLYLKYLGIESYGLVGFFATTQGLLQLLDLGLGPTVNREIARFSASEDLQKAGNFLHTLECVYWVVAVIIGVAVFALGPLISDHWLQPKHIAQETVTHAVMLMGLVVACRWPIGLYQGALIGAQRLTVSSGINVAAATTGNLGALAVLAFVSPTIEAFFVWQACNGLVYVAVMHWAAWRVVGRAGGVSFDLDELRRTWRFSAGMTGIAVATVILMQEDKLLLSKILSLEDFGRYMLAGTVTSGLFVLLSPAFNVIYPRLSTLVAHGNEQPLIDQYRTGTRLFLAVFLPIAVAAATFPREFVALWTGNPALAKSIAPIVSLLVLGTALNGIMTFPYSLQLAYGMVHLPLKIAMVLVFILAPLTVFLATSYGMFGGAAAWAILNGLYLILGTWITHRQLLKGIGIKWLLKDVASPAVLALLIVGFGGQVVRQWGYPDYINLICGAILVCVAACAIAGLMLRPTVSRFFKPGLI